MIVSENGMRRKAEEWLIDIWWSYRIEEDSDLKSQALQAFSAKYEGVLTDDEMVRIRDICLDWIRTKSKPEKVL